MFAQLHKHLQKYISISAKEMQLVEQAFRHRTYKKNQFILQEGEVCKQETFILSGCVRTYETDDKGQEHILQFGLENWWVGDLVSIISGKPSRQNIDCLEPTEVLNISKDDLEQLYIKAPCMERYFRILIQNAYVAATERIYSNLSKSSLGRYQEFIQRYPDIEQRVPNHQIASFLGITPQSLSRIRSQHTGKKRSR